MESHPYAAASHRVGYDIDSLAPAASDHNTFVVAPTTCHADMQTSGIDTLPDNGKVCSLALNNVHRGRMGKVQMLGSVLACDSSRVAGLCSGFQNDLVRADLLHLSLIHI